MAHVDIERGDSGRTLERTGFRLSWGAVFAGMVVATVLQIVLSVLGLAIGLGAWDAGDPLRSFGIGAGVWVLATALVSLFVGGLVAGRLAGVLTRGDGVLHGVIVWGLSALLAVWLVGSGAGAIFGGAFNILGRTVAATAGGVAGAVGQVAGAAGGLDAGAVRDEVERVLRQSGVPELRPESLAAAARDVRQTATSGRASNREVAQQIADLVRERAGYVDREAVVNVLAARTDLGRAEADRVAERVENAVSSMRNRIAAGADTVVESAGVIAESSTDALSRAAWWALLALALSAAAAAGGAAVTARA